jgi:TonB family protein
MKPFLTVGALLVGSLSFAQTAPQIAPPMGKVELVEMLATGSNSERISSFVQHRGIDFVPDAAFLQSLRDDGAEATLLTSLESALVGKANAVGAETASKAAAVLNHLELAARLNRNNFHPQDAEPELRAAVDADPTNAFAHLALGEILLRLHLPSAAAAEFLDALKLRPSISDAHLGLGEILIDDRTRHREALEHVQQAATLAPFDPLTRYSYAGALGVNGDKLGADEQRKIADELDGASIPKRIQVGGRVMSAKLISQARPYYPQKAKSAHVEGTVRLSVLVGKDGAVKDIAVLSGDQMLSEAAVEAVKRWRYELILLRGQPVEAVTEVDVNFHLR